MSFTTNTLFHFTNELETLKKILKYGFLKLYSDESDSVVLHDRIFPDLSWFPMVCFCDIPLTEVQNHTKKYGGYGIGLSKEWGIESGLNPLLYIPKNNFVSRELIKSSKEISSIAIKYNNINITRPFARVYNGQEALSCYMKPYVSDFGYRYYNEREWRYVFDPREAKAVYGDYIEISEVFRLNEINAKKINDIIKRDVIYLYEKRQTLLYDITDIKYIIIPSRNEINELISSIREIKGGKSYPNELINILISKIITLEDISEDF